MTASTKIEIDGADEENSKSLTDKLGKGITNIFK